MHIATFRSGNFEVFTVEVCSFVGHLPTAGDGVGRLDRTCTRVGRPGELKFAAGSPLTQRMFEKVIPV
jgi:hypothetical protein